MGDSLFLLNLSLYVSCEVYVLIDDTIAFFYSHNVCNWFVPMNTNYILKDCLVIIDCDCL